MPTNSAPVVSGRSALPLDPTALAGGVLPTTPEGEPSGPAGWTATFSQWFSAIVGVAPASLTGTVLPNPAAEAPALDSSVAEQGVAQDAVSPEGGIIAAAETTVGPRAPALFHVGPRRFSLRDLLDRKDEAPAEVAVVFDDSDNLEMEPEAEATERPTATGAAPTRAQTQETVDFSVATVAPQAVVAPIALDDAPVVASRDEGKVDEETESPRDEVAARQPDKRLSRSRPKAEVGILPTPGWTPPVVVAATEVDPANVIAVASAASTDAVVRSAPEPLPANSFAPMRQAGVNRAPVEGGRSIAGRVAANPAISEQGDFSSMKPVASDLAAPAPIATPERAPAKAEDAQLPREPSDSAGRPQDRTASPLAERTAAPASAPKSVPLAVSTEQAMGQSAKDETRKVTAAEIEPAPDGREIPDTVSRVAPTSGSRAGRLTERFLATDQGRNEGAAQFAAPRLQANPAGRVIESTTVKNAFQVTDKKELKISVNDVGINQAEPKEIMPTVLSQPSTPAVSVPAPAAPQGMRAEVTRMIERVEEVARQVASLGEKQVDLKIDLASGQQVAVRVSMQGGQVHASFRTESPELRDALAGAWQNFTRQSDASAVSWAEPRFASGIAAGFGGNATSGDSGAQSQSSLQVQTGGFSGQLSQDDQGKGAGQQAPQDSAADPRHAFRAAGKAWAPAPAETVVAPAATASRLSSDSPQRLRVFA